MNRLKRLQDRHAAIVAEMRAMSDELAAKDQDAFDEEQTKKFELLKTELAGVESSLKVELDILEQEKKLRAVRDKNSDTAEELAAKEGQQQPKPSLYPAVFRRHSKLRAFLGNEGPKTAYRFSHFIMATLGRERSMQWCKDAGVQMLAQSEGTNSAGGYLVPDEFSQTIIDLREQFGVFRRNTRLMPMSSDTLLVPRRDSGLTAYFVGENNAITESDKAWSQVQLIAKKLATLTRYSSELDEDAMVSIGDDLASEIAYAFANKEDLCGFTGTGTSDFGGIQGVAWKINLAAHSASVHTAASGHTAFATLDLADFHGVVGKLPLYARANARWYVSALGFATSMERLMYAGGGNTVSTIGGGSGPSFLGYPVEISQVLNSTAGADINAIKVLFGDLRLASMMGDRRGIAIRTSEERYFENDQIAIRGTERVDINVHDLGSTEVAGPMVALKTPGS